MSVIKDLYKVIEERKKNPQEGSYTSYLFEKGIDKILKKIGEESAETIIAAKNNNKEELINEISDLTYHILVLMCEMGITVDEVESVLKIRRQKTGNLKEFHNSKNDTL